MGGFIIKNLKIKKMIKFIYKVFAHDKMLHFFFGTLLTLIGFALYLQNGIISEVFILPLFIGVVKELNDYFIRKTVFSWIDLLFTNLTSIILTLIITFS